MAAAIVLMACSESESVPSAPDVGTVNRLDGPPLEEPDWIQFEATLSGSGGLPGWTNPSESHSRTLTVTYDWSYPHEVWNVENLFVTSEPLFSGYAQASAVDVAESLKDFDSYEATNRTGAAMSLPGSQPPLDLPGTGAPAVFSVSQSTSRLREVRASSEGRANPPRFTSAERRATRSDRIKPSARNFDRVKARLRSQFGPGSRTSEGLLEFRRQDADREVRAFFDPGIGAVTRVARFERGQRRAETTRRYVRSVTGWQLESIVTETFDSTGTSGHRSVLEIRDIRVESRGPGGQRP